MANRAQLIISITDTGKVEVSGPINDKLTCYAMLEAGKDAIREFHESQAKSKIVPANGAAVDMLAARRM
jgi:hypothetical protein